ncbi:MAG: hypothetical protein ACREEE_08050 [Dongiaceae bacterium]
MSAVLFYGSCMRAKDPLASDNPVFDFYVVADRYWNFYRNPMLSLVNWLLPPNVFYFELPWQDSSLRAKYAVVSLDQLRRRVGPAGFHSYFWARLSQPMRLAFVRGDETRSDIVNVLRQAVVTLFGQSIGLMQGRFTARSLWIRAYQESYRAELRAENQDRSTLIYEADRSRNDAMAQDVLATFGVQASRRDAELEFDTVSSGATLRWTQRIWALRRLAGKLLSSLRLIKAAFTFDGATHYILWKIERHSGIKPNMTAWEKRHPLVSAPAIAWRLYRQGAFR